MTASLATIIGHAQDQLLVCGPCDRGDLTQPCSHPMGDPRAVIAELLPEVQKLAEVQRLLELSVPTSVAAQVLAEIRDLLTDEEPA